MNYLQVAKKIKEYKPPAIDYGWQNAISYSQMSIYQQCPKRWEFQYKDKNRRFSSTINTVFGTAIHETLQSFLDKMYAESKAAAERDNWIEYFETKFREEYLKQFNKNNKIHFSTSEELDEFYSDGVEIINDFIKHVSHHFTKKGTYLVGCEIPVRINPDKDNENLIFQGFIDILIYDEDLNTFKVIDIKTSRASWTNNQKKDNLKQYQLILYKYCISKIFDIDPKHIEIEFFIVKRKLWDKCDFPQKRIQLFHPPSGKIKTKKAVTMMDEFVNECFDGIKHVEKEYEYNKGDSCKWCPYKGDKLCAATYKKPK